MIKYLLIAIMAFSGSLSFAQGLNKHGQVVTATTAILNKNGGVGLADGVSKTGSIISNVLKSGSQYQGGLVVYIFQNGDPGYVSGETHGLIISDADVGYAPWGCPGTTTNATGTALGTGADNTNKIVAACTTAGSPARLCADYEGGGYTDWYLPSRDELNKIYQNLSSFTNISTYIYWSSSETNVVNAMRQNMTPGNGSQQAFGKTSHSHVRAMRTF